MLRFLQTRSQFQALAVIWFVMIGLMSLVEYRDNGKISAIAMGCTYSLLFVMAAWFGHMDSKR